MSSASEDRPVDALMRARRRRATVTTMLRGAPRDEVADAAARTVEVLQLAFADVEPVELVRSLYRAILRRDVDCSGEESWTAELVGGAARLDIARTLADSAEALLAPPHRRERVLEHLSLWSDVLVAVDTGLVPWSVPAMGATPGRARHEVTVLALFEAGLGRPPTQSERVADVDRLTAGVPREVLVEMFAGRPEVVRRLTGRSWGRVRRRLARRRLARRLMPTVAAAEERRLEAVARSVASHQDAIDRARAATAPEASA